MELVVESDEAERLVAELVELTGESVDDVIIAALEERLERVKSKLSAAGSPDQRS